MKMKNIDIGTYYMFLVLLCCTGVLGFYKYLPGGSTYYETDYINILLLIVIALFGISRLIIKGKVNVSSKFLKTGIILLVIAIVEVIVTYFRYRQSLVLVIKESIFYFVPILAFVVLLQFNNRNNFKKYIDMIVRFSIAASIIAIVAYVLYSYSEINLLKINLTTQTFRNGTLRFTIGSGVLNLGMIISISRFVNKKYEKIDILNILLTSFQIIVINKTRSVIVYLIIIIILTFIYEKKVNTVVKTTLIIAIVVSLLLLFAYGDNINSSLTNYINKDSGLMIRFQTISFYMKQFLNHPLLGMGFISSSKKVEGWQLLYGVEGRYYRSDVGIVGTINEFGIIGFIWVVVFLIRIYKTVRNNTSVEASILRNYTIFLTVSMANLSFMSPSICMYIFFALMMSDFIQKKYYYHEIGVH